MARGVSIHIGLNEIDPAHYGTAGLLRGCENDARAMQSIATTYGYESTILLTREATALNVLKELSRAAGDLSSGDTLFLSYAGHGSQVRDPEGEEIDSMDETWCLYDRMLLDDELYQFWSDLQPGVRVVMVSDSCHSATMSRYIAELEDLKQSDDLDLALITPRGLPTEIAEEVVANNGELYQDIKQSAFRDLPGEILSTVLLLAACQDNQTAGDGAKNGKFTEALLLTWNDGRFRGDYKQLLDDISKRLSKQTPNYSTVGVSNPAFERQAPFTISGARVEKPQGPGTAAPAEEPASLSIDERLAKLKAAYQNGARGNGEPVGTGCKFEIGIDRSIFNQMNDRDIYDFLRNDGCDALMKAYMQAATVATPRGAEGSLACHVSDKGKVDFSRCVIHF